MTNAHPMTPKEIAREAAEAISNASRESIKRGDGLPSVNELTLLILAAAAKMVSESGAVEALQDGLEAASAELIAHDANYGRNNPANKRQAESYEATVSAIKSALAKLRAIGEGKP